MVVVLLAEHGPSRDLDPHFSAQSPYKYKVDPSCDSSLFDRFRCWPVVQALDTFVTLSANDAAGALTLKQG